jgi:cytochrome c553
MRKLLLLAGVSMMAMQAQAADINAGQRLSASCAACHGQKGISSNPLYPNLAGQKAPYLVKQMRDFKTGKRQDPVMSAMVKSLDEEAMNNIAEYYSQLAN